MIDLRSDTVTQPDHGMRQAMMDAALGDDVWGDDPTVARLQSVMAERSGKERALFFPSGTQSNLAAVLAHCGRGQEIIVGRQAHIYKYEAGGASAFGGVVYCPLDNRDDGSLDPGAVAANIKPYDPHFPATRLLCLENTFNGKVLDADYVAQATALARSKGLATHLDGARGWNAAVADNADIAEIVHPFDSVSLCFSKGLGTPAGTVLCGSREFVDKAHRLRKALGGGMRQTGILAAACLYALEHNFARLREDHATARQLRDGLASIPEIGNVSAATNMVFFDVPEAACTGLGTFLKERSILLDIKPRTRAVTNLGVGAKDIDRLVELVTRFFGERRKDV